MPAAGGVPFSIRASYWKLLPATRGLVSTTVTPVGRVPALKTVKKALGGSFLKLFLPSVHCFRNRSLRIWPTIRLGRSEKKVVPGETPSSVKIPSLNATFFAVWTNRTCGELGGALVCAVVWFVAVAQSDAIASSVVFLITCIVASCVYTLLETSTVWGRAALAR